MYSGSPFVAAAIADREPPLDKDLQLQRRLTLLNRDRLAPALPDQPVAGPAPRSCARRKSSLPPAGARSQCGRRRRPAIPTGSWPGSRG